LTVGSLLSLGAGLALVLGLMAVLVWVARGVRPGLFSSGSNAMLEVLSRLPLAQRQGIAVVRFQDRLLLVSYGEGGVRLLREELDETLDEEAGDLDYLSEGSPLSSPADLGGGASSGNGAFNLTKTEPSFPRLWNRIRRAAGIGGALLFMGLLGGFQEAGAQALSPEAQEILSQAREGLDGLSVPGGVQDPEAQEAEGRGPSPLSPEGAVFGLVKQLPNMDLQIGEEDGGLQLNGPVGTVLFIGFLTLLPTLLLMMTGFTRILVVLHLLKQALGTQTAPPTHLLTAMALILTGFVMAPTLTEVNQRALTPWMDGEMDELQMIRTASGPFRDFMLSSTREEDLSTFLEMHGSATPTTVNEIPMVVVTSAFVTSELRHAFQMGFALFLPFVVIDIVVASVLMSMGMFMLPPVMVSLPFKLLLFVLVDGWSLIVGGLVRSFG
jgi:flagellar biosynthetic protein FliP